MSYSAIEEELRKCFINHFPELSEATCKISDLDGVFLSMMEKDLPLGCILDFAGGGKQPVHPFKDPIWSWEIGGVFYIRFMGDPKKTDDLLRETVDGLQTVLDKDPRLNGTSALATMIVIEPPEPGKINDMPFYFLPFLVRALDK